MAKVKMKKIEIAALLTDSKKLIERLQRRGVIELIDCTDPELLRMNTSASISLLEKNAATANAALELLSTHVVAKKSAMSSLTSMLSGRREIEKHSFGELAAKADGYMSMCYDILAQGRRISDQKSAISRSEVLYDQLKVWKELELPQQYKGTEHTACFIGTLPGRLTGDAILERLVELDPQLTAVDAEVVGGSGDISCVVINCHRSIEKETFAALRDMGFAAPSDPTKHPPRVRLERYRSDIRKAGEAIDQAEKKIRSYDGRQGDIEFLIDYLVMRRDKYRALSDVGMTANTIIITGYIPAPKVDALVKEIEGRFSAAITVSDPDENEDVPVVLANSGFTTPVESVTEMYAMPDSKDLDPTPIFSFFYYLFFGLMLSDAGYGLLMTVVTGLILKFSTVEGNLRRSLKMFMYCGISTLFWGALFGSWFGDIIPVIAREYFGKTITTSQLALWFEPMADPIKLLLVSFALGIVHLFVGVGANCYNLIRQHRIFDAIFDTLPTYMILLGVCPAGASILTEVNPTLSQYGLYLALAGVVILVLTGSRTSKNPLLRLGGGLYALYNFASGYLGDVLSYSRLLALGLATGSIAGVINMMGVMPGNMVLKTVLLVVVFIFGHALNIAINLLGAYVHTARLQFVEFFSKFYEGGGRAFEPLKVNTKYVKFKEEK